MRTTRLRVTLRDVSPTVTRVVDVPASTTLPELHDLLQAAMGWTDSHLHEFIAGEVHYGVPDPDAWEEQQDESGVGFQQLPAHFVYHYDLGDSWQHDVEVLGPGDDVPGCRSGEGACPPEDCGGPPGYQHLRDVLADPADPEHEQLAAWAGPLRDFDLVETDLLVRQTVGTVPDSVRLVLQLAEGGVKLTPGGRLPRIFVRQVQEQRPQWHPLDRPAAIEDDLPPLAALHDLLRSAGLLRLRNGVLSPTRATQDGLAVVRRLRAWFERDQYECYVAAGVAAVLAARGPQPLEDIVEAVHAWLGPGWSLGGAPLRQQDLRRHVNQISLPLVALDLVDDTRPKWQAGPSARTLLPRATALAYLWSGTSTST